MSTVTLPQVINIVAELPPDDQQALYDYLSDILPLQGKPIVQVAGTFGSPIPPEAGDLIAEELALLRRERNQHFDEEWEE
jgi:hypothetical protein